MKLYDNEHDFWAFVLNYEGEISIHKGVARDCNGEPIACIERATEIEHMASKKALEYCKDMRADDTEPSMYWQKFYQGVKRAFADGYKESEAKK
jgi:hypothetical protein